MPRKERAPQEFTPEKQRAIIRLVTAGTPDKVAAEACGISPRTFRLWKTNGRRQKTGKYATFFAALKKAESDRIAACVGRILKAGEGGLVERTTTVQKGVDGKTVTKIVEKTSAGEWQALAWFLERTCEVFASNKKDIAALNKAMAEVLKETRARVKPDDRTG